jgi:hypothetical protein
VQPPSLNTVRDNQAQCDGPGAGSWLGEQPLQGGRELLCPPQVIVAADPLVIAAAQPGALQVLSPLVGHAPEARLQGPGGQIVAHPGRASLLADLIGDDPDAEGGHPGPRLHAQNQQLQSLLTAPNTDVAARLRAEAAVGAIWRPLIAQPPLDLTSPAHQRILIDAALATLPPSRPSPDGRSMPAAQSAGTPSTSSERCRPHIACR